MIDLLMIYDFLNHIYIRKMKKIFENRFYNILIYLNFPQFHNLIIYSKYENQTKMFSNCLILFIIII